MAVTTSALRVAFSTRFSPNPTEQQERLIDAFEAALPGTHLVRWDRGDSFPSGVFILVGVMVSWNRYDQELVAALDEAVAEGRTSGDVIAVLAMDHMRSPQGAQAVFPGIEAATAPTPYLGQWEDGRLQHVDHGASAVSFLFDRYGLHVG